MNKIKIGLLVLALTAVFIGCDNLGEHTGTDSNNYFTFEGDRYAIRNIESVRTGDTFLFKLYAGSDAASSDHFIELSFPASYTDTLFTIPLSRGEWSVNGAIKDMPYNGNRAGRIGFQSANVQIKVLDGAGSCDLKFSLALNDNRCVNGFYKGTINNY
ncbi:MAG: hypothetical protein PHZ13_07520 [bacterium]|nr:hypothetical protein [bacterium]MDD3967231.1 hypothetical protein [Proteiniphilum sp.]MDD4458493.1 hypothetical protein [Proteiniphilum sp.]